MKQITDNLIQLSDNLDNAGKRKCANLVDGLIKNKSVTKVAQYVGVIGYVLKQNRAMGNCIRKKRVASSSSMQEVIMECLSEYQDGQSYGNNDWTAKYAQVVQQTSEHFDSSCTDFLEAIAEENKIGEHVEQMENAQKSLEADGFDKTIVSSVLSDLNALLKEGDVAHRPFKVAAPQSPRSRWSRFWSPSWSRGGKDKDTKYEMDIVSESIGDISRQVQRMRTNISHLRELSMDIPDKEFLKNVNSLSATNWNETIGRMKNMSQILSRIKEQSNSQRSIRAASLLLYKMNKNVQNIYNLVSKVQRNMYNLRQREPVKGRGKNNPSATNEFADLERALTRLYANPLDEKSLYYSHKLHGQLEDALNMRPAQNDREFGQWANEPMDHPQEVPGVSMPVTNGPENPISAPTLSVDSVVDDLKLMDNRDLTTLIALLNRFRAGDILPQSRVLMGTIIEDLQNPSRIAQEYQDTAQESQGYDPKNFGDTGANWDNMSFEEDPIAPLTPETKIPPITGFNIKTLRKMADKIEPLDADLAKLLHEYLKEEDLLPNFLEISPILKEEAASKLKITQIKGGKIVVC